jgi:hypothetical protein
MSDDQPQYVPAVVAEKFARLQQLAAEYAVVKPTADEWKARLESIVGAIKLELTQAAPGATRVDLRSAALERPLRLQAKTQWRLDMKKLKAEAPEVYVRYAVQSTFWELRTVQDGS